MVIILKNVSRNLKFENVLENLILRLTNVSSYQILFILYLFFYKLEFSTFAEYIFCLSRLHVKRNKDCKTPWYKWHLLAVFPLKPSTKKRQYFLPMFLFNWSKILGEAIKTDRRHWSKKTPSEKSFCKHIILWFWCCMGGVLEI